MGKGMNYQRANKRMRVVEQNLQRRHAKPVLGPRVRVCPAIPALRLTQTQKNKTR